MRHIRQLLSAIACLVTKSLNILHNTVASSHHANERGSGPAVSRARLWRSENQSG